MPETTNMGLSPEAIMYCVHHVFLPPKLPHKDDFDWNHEEVLLGITLDALVKFKDGGTNEQISVIDSVILMVANLRKVHDSSGSVGVVSESELTNMLKDLCNTGKHISSTSRNMIN